MARWWRRVIPGNARVTTALVYTADPMSVQAASLGAMTNTFSPGSAGGVPSGFGGDPGMGVNAWHGAGLEPVQHFGGLAAPVADPTAQRLGAGAGPSGQPGMPSTGDLTGAMGWTAGLPINTGMGA